MMDLLESYMKINNYSMVRFDGSTKGSERYSNKYIHLKWKTMKFLLPGYFLLVPKCSPELSKIHKEENNPFLSLLCHTTCVRVSMKYLQNQKQKGKTLTDNSFSTYAKFSGKLTFLTP